MRAIGIDLGRDVAAVAIHEEGRTTPGGTLAMTRDAVTAFAAGLHTDDAVVIEATLNTWTVADILAPRAGRLVVSNPTRTRAIADAKTKTDALDAATLASLLAADYLPAVWRPDPATRALRSLVAGRAALVRDRTAARNRVGALLAGALIVPPAGDLFGRRGRAWLTADPLPGVEPAQLACLLRVHDALAAEVREHDRALAQHLLADPRAARLLGLPGVGPVVAAALLALVGDIGRFPEPGCLVAAVGLDPRVRQTGGHPARTGRISRSGSAMVRGLLVEAARGAIRLPGPLRAFHERLSERRGRGVAIVAVARKLLVLAWHLLARETEYRARAPLRTADKLRRLERLAGLPRRPPSGVGPGGSRERRRSARAAEWAMLEALEADYRAAVDDRSRPKTACPGSESR